MSTDYDDGLTFLELVMKTHALKRDHPEYRTGQCIFTELHRYRPDLSERVRGTTLDPFYRDDECSDFLQWIRENW